MIDKKDLISIRDSLPNDRNFILATWLRGLYYGDTWFKEIPKAIFFENYHNVVERILTRPGTIIKIACLKDDPDVILGYCVSRVFNGDINVVDWAFVKSAWRNIGIAKRLLPAKVHACTHHTKQSLGIAKKKFPSIIFNPFLT